MQYAWLAHTLYNDMIKHLAEIFIVQPKIVTVRRFEEESPAQNVNILTLK